LRRSIEIDKDNTAVLVTGAQNDFLSEQGVIWELVGDSVKENKTTVCSLRKVYATENNDVALQLRKRNINKVILARLSANLTGDAHKRDFLERGFKVAVVKDSTADARHPELGDVYKAALIKFGFMANAVLSTDEVEEAMS
jgi:nicotinamidase-related amidase